MRVAWLLIPAFGCVHMLSGAHIPGDKVQGKRGLLGSLVGKLFGGCDQAEDIGGYKHFSRQDSAGTCIKSVESSVRTSTFDGSKPTYFFIHGYLGSGWNWYIGELREELMRHEDCNFVVVDWSKGSFTINLLGSYLDADTVGTEIAKFVHLFYEKFGQDPKKVHLIGHSMGGRVAGLAGSKISPRVGRITGLDPVPGTYFNDAEFVQIIHSTSLALIDMGHVDFYPNGGHMTGLIPWVSAHLRVIDVFTASIKECEFTAYNCKDYDTFKATSCYGNAKNRMGFHADPQGARGKLFITINNDRPFC